MALIENIQNPLTDPKLTLGPKQIFTAQSLSATFTSGVMDIRYVDNIAIHLVIPSTGTPIGTFKVMAAVEPDAPTADYVDLGVSPVPAATGAGDQILINLNQVAAPYIILVYTRTSGTGTMNGWLSGKAI